MALVPPAQRSQTIPCRHTPLDASGRTLDSLYREAEPQQVQDIYGTWLRSAIAKLEEDRKKSRSSAGPAGPAAGGPAIGEPLFGKMHPKCANPTCSAAFHWLAGGRFFRFRPGELAPATKTETAEYSENTQAVKHYWLCESCGQTYTLNFTEDCGVIVEPLWRELPVSQPAKELPATRR